MFFLQTHTSGLGCHITGCSSRSSTLSSDCTKSCRVKLSADVNLLLEKDLKRLGIKFTEYHRTSQLNHNFYFNYKVVTLLQELNLIEVNGDQQNGYSLKFHYENDILAIINTIKYITALNENYSSHSNSIRSIDDAKTYFKYACRLCSDSEEFKYLENLSGACAAPQDQSKPTCQKEIDSLKITVETLHSS